MAIEADQERVDEARTVVKSGALCGVCAWQVYKTPAKLAGVLRTAK